MSNKVLGTDINRRRVLLIVILASVFQMSHMVITVCMSQVSAAFPAASATSVQLLMTFPDLAIFASTLIVGKLSSRIPPRRLILIGLLFCLISGVGGFLLHPSIPVMYVWSVCLGIGRGLYVTMISVIITTCFTDSDRSRALGIQSIAINGGGVVLLLLGGFAASAAWEYHYLVFLLVIPILLVALKCLPEGCTPAQTDNGEKAKLHPSVFILSGVSILFLLVYNVYPSNCAMLMTEYGIGNEALWAGIANGLFLGGGALFSIPFSALSRKFGPRLLVLAFCMLMIGFVLPLLLQNLFGIMLGALVAGMSTACITPQVSLTISQKAHPAALSMSISVFMACLYLGGFFSSPLVTPLAGCFSDTVAARLVVGIALSAVFVIFAFFAVRSKWVKEERD